MLPLPNASGHICKIKNTQKIRQKRCKLWFMEWRKKSIISAYIKPPSSKHLNKQMDIALYPKRNVKVS